MKSLIVFLLLAVIIAVTSAEPRRYGYGKEKFLGKFKYVPIKSENEAEITAFPDDKRHHDHKHHRHEHHHKHHGHKHHHHKHHEHDKPQFCRRFACPKFEIAGNRTEEFEERVYEKANWVQYNTEGDNLRTIMRRSFFPLFRYITGENEDNQTMKMTVPVLTKFQGIDTMRVNTSCHFYLPVSNDTVPPKPTGKGVTLIQTPDETKFYVRVFPRHLFTLDELRLERDLLWLSLDKEGLDYDKETVFFAGYSKPKERLHIHSEIWVAASM